MNNQAYQAVTSFSFGEVQTELKPSSEFKNQTQALDAMLVSAHSVLTSWVIDNTIDPGTKGGKQEKIKAAIESNGQKLADIIVIVPTTENFSKALFENLVQQAIIPNAQKASRAYPSTRTSRPVNGQTPLMQHLSSSIAETSRVNPDQLQTDASRMQSKNR